MTGILVLIKALKERGFINHGSTLGEMSGEEGRRYSGMILGVVGFRESGDIQKKMDAAVVTLLAVWFRESGEWKRKRRLL